MGRSKLSEFKALEKENRRLKKILAELELDKLILKESLDYLKAPGLSAELKRQTVIHVRQKLNTSERRTCNVLGVVRSTMTYQSKDRDEDALRHDIIKFAKMYGRYGYRKIA